MVSLGWGKWYVMSWLESFVLAACAMTDKLMDTNLGIPNGQEFTGETPAE